MFLHGEIFEFFHNSSFALRYFLMQMARPQCDTLLVVVVVAAVLVVVVVYTLPTTSFHCVIHFASSFFVVFCFQKLS